MQRFAPKFQIFAIVHVDDLRSYNSPQDEVFDTEFSALQIKYRLVGQSQIDKECSRQEPPIPLITWLVEALVEQGRVLERDCSVFISGSGDSPNLSL